MKIQRRPQRQKASTEHIRHIQELRRSNAAQPIPVTKEDKRFIKYGLNAIVEDDDDEDEDPYLWN